MVCVFGVYVYIYTLFCRFVFLFSSLNSVVVLSLFSLFSLCHFLLLSLPYFFSSLSFVVIAFLFVAISVFYSSFIWPCYLIRGPLICLLRPTSLGRERAGGLLESQAVRAEVNCERDLLMG